MVKQSSLLLTVAVCLLPCLTQAALEDCYDVIGTKQKAKCYMGNCGDNLANKDSDKLATTWVEGMEVRGIRWDKEKDFNVNLLLGFPESGEFDLVDLGTHFSEEKTCDSQYWTCEGVVLPTTSRITRVRIGYYVESTYTKVASMTLQQSDGDSDIVIGEGRGDRFDQYDFLNSQRLIGIDSYVDGYPEVYKVELLRSTGAACPDALQPGEVPPVDDGTADDDDSSTEDPIYDPFTDPIVIDKEEEEDSGIRSDQIALAVFIFIALIIIGIGVYVLVKYLRDKKKKEGQGEPKDSESEPESDHQFNNLPTQTQATEPDSPRRNNLNNWPQDKNQKDSIAQYGTTQGPPQGQYGQGTTQGWSRQGMHEETNQRNHRQTEHDSESNVSCEIESSGVEEDPRKQASGFMDICRAPQQRTYPSRI